MGDILAYNEELHNDTIVWHHSDIPGDLWVIGTENIAVEMSNAITLPKSVDSTFNFGAYNITLLIYSSVVFQSKSKNVAKKWIPATIVGPSIIHHNKSVDAYESAMRCIANNAIWKTGVKFILYPMMNQLRLRLG